MDPIYVTGHRNPDTDSIVAAISYAALRNACGDREYEAACLGRVSDETQIVLDRFGFLPPKRITDLYNQVRDLDFDKPPILSGGVTMGRAWDEFQAYPAIASIPVVNEDGTLYGILSRTDIADYNMSRTNSGVLEEVPLFNAISVLEGKILNDAGESTDTISGEVTIALPQSRENLLFHSRESIVLCGNQPDMIRRALELNVSCLVLCQAEISEELRTMPTETCIISTPYDAFRAARLIFQSIPVERICNTQNVVSFHLDDRVDTVRDMVLKYRHPSYPILDGSEKVVGILTRYHLLRPRRKQVVRPRSGGSGNSRHYRPSPAGRYPDRQSNLRPQRAGGFHQHHHCRDVSGSGVDALSQAGGHDGGGHSLRHRYVQVSHLHPPGYPHGGTHGPDRRRVSG